MSLDDFFTLRDAMRQLQVSRSFIYSMKNRGVIKFRKLGGKVFIKKEEIERALK